MRRERAGLARAVLLFFAGLAFAGALYAILNGPVEQIAAAGTEYSSTPEAAQGQQYVQSFWDATPFLIVFLSLAQLLGAAASERRLPGQ